MTENNIGLFGMGVTIPNSPTFSQIRLLTLGNCISLAVQACNQGGKREPRPGHNREDKRPRIWQPEPGPNKSGQPCRRLPALSRRQERRKWLQAQQRVWCRGPELGKPEPQPWAVAWSARARTYLLIWRKNQCCHRRH